MSKKEKVIGNIKLKINKEYEAFYNKDPLNKLYYPRVVIRVGIVIVAKPITNMEKEEIRDMPMLVNCPIN